eukprot:TRINITY_DN16049_c0_g1_i1.p1 TRINITY_DN16049_c0_g1~~TRINITY_DN16049_c0_g1_i1.p1  ORF type:complete len:268 (+),score=40.49 TRINITY_DN16049_c0_g1_i1:82-804(+)
MALQLYVKMQSGTIVPVEINPDATVQDVLCAADAPPGASLVWQGATLNPGQCIADTGISSQATVEVALARYTEFHWTNSSTHDQQKINETIEVSQDRHTLTVPGSSWQGGAVCFGEMCLEPPTLCQWLLRFEVAGSNSYPPWATTGIRSATHQGHIFRIACGQSTDDGDCVLLSRTAHRGVDIEIQVQLFAEAGGVLRGRERGGEWQEIQLEGREAYYPCVALAHSYRCTVLTNEQIAQS